ncbi:MULTISPECIES: MalY/PatB family protein [unclassified Pseudomonas]|uniref:MalY/PatB family protein n=1 Tax=unclassified Pseudomonas TaxID=196821 RepID=UPI000D346063|nr:MULTISPECIES: MalY/PatB family protein [unclassified Pseudomonas]RAU40334.1 pyridoxal phosphate-dependent aminotransferase [Pseudomonas sp. RIT 409]RAU55509.1 pyridoxal phosphate-dependent aminotransferase [Pseudomonas sp. RIT 412]
MDLNSVYQRLNTGSKKWSQYPEDVLPMWVADMDFPVAEPIVMALRNRLEHPLLGYCVAQDSLRQTLVDHLARHYDWVIEPEDLVFLPGVEPGVNMALNTLVPAGGGVLVQTPNYSPLLHAPAHWKLPRVDLPFRADANGEYPTDLEALQRGLARSRALLLSNPHNPLGKVFEPEELRAIGEACVQRDVLIVSDEIHADILFDGRRHTPIASLSAEIAERTITLMSASKAWNIAGLKTAFAVVQNAALRERFNNGRLGLVDSVNALGLEATEAAYRLGADWLAQVNAYLQGNRDYLAQTLQTRFPGIRMNLPQSTYLAWLDCSALDIEHPQQFFLKHARVALSDGLEFGAECGQFVRLNFGCPRSMLEEALARMERSLQRR